MSSTPIYDELAATYLADFLPDPARPAPPDEPGEHASPPAAQSPPRPPDHTRPEV
ncbi:hypothetical protein LZG04_30705 [Saccharothrix sp. S26]|uniref:hypothetical protein n=1 Tax=Saccharothrix sp. S26 TaxID=2907215 RepID=UPI001F3C7DFD|nr:hypothetical protein [Saccharothrix sp. S26]MCE6999143.1 hypothetical protein [Saccharothrix sp. S26]